MSDSDAFEADVDVEYRHGQKNLTLLFRHGNQSWRAVSLLPSEWQLAIDVLIRELNEQAALDAAGE